MGRTRITLAAILIALSLSAGRAHGEASAAEESPLFRYAVATFGEPLSHKTTTEKFEGHAYPTTVWKFRGATLTDESEPPETVRKTLVATHPLPDEKAARAALDAEAGSKGWQCRFDWSAKPEAHPAKSDGTVTRTYWEQGGGNCGADLIERGGKLVGLGLHQAL